MDGWPALSIHGDKSQQERDWVLAEFKQNKSPIMLATDVAARGLGRTAIVIFEWQAAEYWLLSCSDSYSNHCLCSSHCVDLQMLLFCLAID